MFVLLHVDVSIPPSSCLYSEMLMCKPLVNPRCSCLVALKSGVECKCGVCRLYAHLSPMFWLYASCLLFLASCMCMYVCGCGDSWAAEQDDEHRHDEEDDEEVEEAAGSASSTPRLRGWGAASPRSGGKGFPDGAGESGHGSGRRQHEMQQQVQESLCCRMSWLSMLLPLRGTLSSYTHMSWCDVLQPHAMGTCDVPACLRATCRVACSCCRVGYRSVLALRPTCSLAASVSLAPPIVSPCHVMHARQQ